MLIKEKVGTSFKNHLLDFPYSIPARCQDTWPVSNLGSLYPRQHNVHIHAIQEISIKNFFKLIKLGFLWQAGGRANKSKVKAP